MKPTTFVLLALWLGGLPGAIAFAAEPEIGEINGAQFRIDKPDNWNQVLIIYCHGYNRVPVTFKAGEADGVAKGLTEFGFAVAQSGYAAGGWAVQEAMQDTQALRRYFVKKHGAPKEIYVMGHSMGGHLTMALVESFPNDYDGGLALCGPLAPAMYFFTRHLFDSLALFAYYYPGIIGDLSRIPAEQPMGAPLASAITKVLEADPDRASAMRAYMGVRNNQDLVGTIGFFTYILQELQKRAGGNPFDNRDTIYTGTSDDIAVNAGIKRYTADAHAAEYLRTYFTPKGHLTKPLLAVHTVYDPLVPGWVPNQYALLSSSAGSGNLFVQQYVTNGGHCNIPGPQVLHALEDLRAWKQKGTRPKAGLRD